MLSGFLTTVRVWPHLIKIQFLECNNITKTILSFQVADVLTHVPRPLKCYLKYVCSFFSAIYLATSTKYYAIIIFLFGGLLNSVFTFTRWWKQWEDGVRCAAIIPAFLYMYLCDVHMMWSRAGGHVYNSFIIPAWVHSSYTTIGVRWWRHTPWNRRF